MFVLYETLKGMVKAWNHKDFVSTPLFTSTTTELKQ